MTRTIATQSRRPPATPLAMSVATAQAEPTPSPIPQRDAPQRDAPQRDAPQRDSTSDSASRPRPRPSIPQPKLRLEVRDLGHAGTLGFFETTNPLTVLADAVTTVLQTLYLPSAGKTDVPPTRSITLVLRPMDGVAYTTGSDLDEEHKEIHFNVNYIASQPKHRQRDEIRGVLFHEMVHVWQWAARGTCPGGLVEGIADFVRLRAGLAPPHWKRELRDNWDAAYQHTAYFLDFLEGRYGGGKVAELNGRLKDREYREEEIWPLVFGKGVDGLFDEYRKTFDGGKDAKQGAAGPKPGEMAGDHAA